MRRTDSIVKLIALGVVIANVAPLGAYWYWGFELASHFRVQYVVLDVLLLTAFALRRKWLWTAALAGCAAYSATWVVPYLPFGPSAARAPSPDALRSSIKLMAVNVLFRNDSTDALLEMVRRESPDVLLLVEYTQAWSAKADELRTAYPHHLEGPSYGSSGIALFSRFPFDTIDAVRLGLSIAIEAQVRTPSGPLALIGVHLRSPSSPARSAHRDRQLNFLAERLDAVTGPVVIMGDFNITPYSPFYTDWLERTELTDTRRGRTLSPSWPTFLPILAVPIDHFVVSTDIAIIAHRGLPSFGSDHYPIVTEIALPTRHAGISNVTGSP